MLGPLFTWKFMLMVSILVGCVFIFRLFCRFICPLGALYGLFNKISIFGVKVEKSKCTDCGLCFNHCKVDIKSVGDQECIGCGECISVCPTKAIQWKGSNIFLKANETKASQNVGGLKFFTRVISALLLVGILAGAIFYYWEPSKPSNFVPENQVNRGNQVGDLCYGEQLKVITPNGVMAKTVDPTKSGKVTVINFWGTWCTPCCAELPFFQQIADEYGDSVTVYAVHSYLLANETAAAYIATNYAGSSLNFLADYAIDDNGTSGYYTSLGGRGTYPYTVVLDESGVITKIFVSSVTYDMLKAAVEDAINN